MTPKPPELGVLISPIYRRHWSALLSNCETTRLAWGGWGLDFPRSPQVHLQGITQLPAVGTHRPVRDTAVCALAGLMERGRGQIQMPPVSSEPEPRPMSPFLSSSSSSSDNPALRAHLHSDRDRQVRRKVWSHTVNTRVGHRWGLQNLTHAGIQGMLPKEGVFHLQLKRSV